MSDEELNQARRVIEDLLCHPPLNPEDQSSRLADLARAALRRALLERLEQDSIGPAEEDVARSLFATLGVGDQATRMLRFLADGRGDKQTRRVLLAALEADGSVPSETVLRHISPGEVLSMAASDWTDLLTAAAEDPSARAGIARYIESVPGPHRLKLFECFELCRQTTDTSAAEAYQEVLAKNALAPVHKQVFAALRAECRVTDIPVLEELAARVSRKPVRREVQRALLRARTLEASGPEALSQWRIPEGTAYVGACDGQGAFVVIAAIHQREDEHVLTQICIRVAEDVRDGFSEHKRTLSDLEDLVHQTEDAADIPVTRVPMGEVVTLVQEAVERTAATRRTLPDGVGLGLRQLERIPPSTIAADNLLSQARAEDADPVGLREALERPEHRWWFFDAGDLMAARVDAHLPDESEERWLEKAIRRLNNPEIRNRLLGMIRHMVRWHHWGGDHDLARLFAAAHRATELEQPALIRAMAEYTLSLRDRPLAAPRRRLRIGDPDNRHYLRRTLFADVSEPTVHDLVALDFTEVAYVVLDEESNRLPGAVRPRSDQLDRLAFMAGTTLADVLLELEERGSGWADRRMEQMEQTFADLLQVDLSQVRSLNGTMVERLRGFLTDTCGRCSVQCVDRPHQDVTAEFFATRHPAQHMLT